MTTQQIKAYVNAHLPELYELHRELCIIPAPSHKEEKRAEYVKAWFDKNCTEGAYIDSALNVIYPYMAEGKNTLTVVCAHTDTVFPDLTPMPFVEDGDYLRCPGVGDDTASLAVLMIVAKCFVENGIKADGGLLFVANSCEEGLGNLKGTRQLFSDYEGRIARLVSFDAKLGGLTPYCVGSHRYLVNVKTEGGHSWGAFGKLNAITELSSIITEIYKTELPVLEGYRVTYNVGTIEGGTSVNTIAQSASMLCEYRSDSRELLAFMQKRFADIFAAARREGVEVEVTLVGERPCMGEVDKEKHDELIKLCADALFETTGDVAKLRSGSTDCNIPLSLGIPAIAAGVYIGGGTHTREEWILKSSFTDGLEVGLRTVLKLAETL